MRLNILNVDQIEDCRQMFLCDGETLIYGSTADAVETCPWTSDEFRWNIIFAGNRFWFNAFVFASTTSVVERGNVETMIAYCENSTITENSYSRVQCFWLCLQSQKFWYAQKLFF